MQIRIEALKMVFRFASIVLLAVTKIGALYSVSLRTMLYRHLAGVFEVGYVSHSLYTLRTLRCFESVFLKFKISSIQVNFELKTITRNLPVYLKQSAFLQRVGAGNE